jgi:molybdenum cofactor biosynthesis protein B
MEEGPDMGHKEHKDHAVSGAMCAVLTISYTRTIENDTSGSAIVELLESSGHKPIHMGIVPDDTEGIQSRVSEILSDGQVQALVITGGTGISSRDVTVEAVAPLVDTWLDGFGELFRNLSYEEVGSAAMMSRAFAGIADGRPVFCLPGSEKACRLAVERLIAPELGHMLWEVSR